MNSESEKKNDVALEILNYVLKTIFLLRAKSSEFMLS